MRTALRRMGNSTGIIVPRALLAELGARTGESLDLSVVDGRLIAERIVSAERAGWADAASAIAGDDDADGRAWRAFGNAEDAERIW